MLQKLKNRPLRQQVIVPMLIVGCICFGVMIYSVYRLQSSIVQLGEIYVSSDMQLRVIENIETGVSTIRALGLKHLASEKFSNMQRIRAEFESARTRLQQQLGEVVGKEDAEDQDFIDHHNLLVESLQLYLQQIAEVIRLSDDFEKESAFVRLSASDSNSLPAVSENLRNLKRHASMNITDLRGHLRSDAEKNLVATMTIGLAGIGLFIIIALFVLRRVTLRIAHLMDWTREVSAGDLEVPLVVDSEDEVGYLTRSMRDMAQNIKQAHDELYTAKLQAEDVASELQLYANAFESSGEAMLITDAYNRILNVNAAFTRQTGYVPEEVIGKDPKILSSGKTPIGIFHEMWNELKAKGFWQGELWDRKRNGETYPKWIRISAIRDENDKVLFYIASFTDISDRKEAEARIEHLAHYDILTGLHNRYSMEERLEQVIVTAQREKQRLALLFIDLDRFKNVNDSLGHHVGDDLLIEVAGRLRECVRDSDIVARIGGDEFVVVLAAIHDNSHAAVVAENILHRLSRQYEVSGHMIDTSSSIGISIYPDDSATSEELMRTADVAMYHAKEHGRNNYQYFNEAMLVEASKRLRIERELRVAVHSSQLVLYYQPQVSASDDRIVSLEALVRWNHPVDGLLYPDLFIPIAEESGLIHDLGCWVLAEACRQLVAWRAAGHSGFRIAINLSAKQLQLETLGRDIEAILKDHAVAGEDIEVEVTETAAMSEPMLAVKQLNALRELGISLAIDDFGTGYSSLAYLKRLPINTLKLDRSFVRDIESDQNDAEICSATVALAHNLGLKVVAEGVENAAQRDYLVRLNCDYLQGYFYSKPMQASEMTKLLAAD
jgi:diguanylate cyclase (GGDEF)-like protein/PAS domain S-box-containing protein